ncbi:MAG: peptidylprolyl isomerase [Saprospiraceae bacterium]
MNKNLNYKFLFLSLLLILIHSMQAQDTVHIQIETPIGIMKGYLYNETPQHRDNFVKLAEEGFYDSLLFHRVIPGFMIQGGDPDSKNAKPGVPLGMGGPKNQVPAEFVDSLAHVKGAIAAARNNNAEKKSSGSQFYIVAGRPISNSELALQEFKFNFHYPESVKQEYSEKGGVPFLDHDYTVFGKITEGLELIDQIAASMSDGRNRPLDNVWMKIVIIK